MLEHDAGDLPTTTADEPPDSQVVRALPLPGKSVAGPPPLTTPSLSAAGPPSPHKLQGDDLDRSPQSPRAGSADAPTPRLDVSPGRTETESTLGSPSSVTSLTSFGGSLARGDLADVEDADADQELDQSSEPDADAASFSSLDIHDEEEEEADKEHGSDARHAHGAGDADRYHLLRYSAPTASRLHQYARPASANVASAPLAHNDAEAPFHGSRAPSSASASLRSVLRPRKGRVSEIIGDGGEMPHTTSPQPRVHTHGASHLHAPPDWETETLPPMPPSALTPMDTVPAVPSPLSTCTNADPGASGEESRGRRDASRDSQSSGSTAGGKTGLSESTETLRPRSRSVPRRRSALRGGSSERSSSEEASPPHPRSKSLNRQAQLDPNEPERPRGRSLAVRFCAAPPSEARTHSPDEYDRKAYPVHSRLSTHDLEEMRTLKMELGLLESKWALANALHANGSRSASDSEDSPHGGHEGTNGALASHNGHAEHHGPCSAAQQHARRMATGRAAPSAHGRPCPAQSIYSEMTERFGLSKPPPPLPGGAQCATAAPEPRSALTSSSETMLPLKEHQRARDCKQPIGAPQPMTRTTSLPTIGHEGPCNDLYDSGSEYDLLP